MQSTLIGQNGLKELYRIEQEDPSGEIMTHFEGAVSIEAADGTLLETPDRPMFTDPETAEAWLNSCGETSEAKLVGLVEKYLELRGERTVSVDKDGTVRVTNFLPEPVVASDFWDENIATLDLRELHKLHSMLPKTPGR